jgi:hypothetical protein
MAAMTESPEPLKASRPYRALIADLLVCLAVMLVGLWICSIFGRWSRTSHSGSAEFELGLGEGCLKCRETKPGRGESRFTQQRRGGTNGAEELLGRFRFRRFGDPGAGFQEYEVAVPFTVLAVTAGFSAYLIRRRFRITLLACLTATAVISVLFAFYGRLLPPD